MIAIADRRDGWVGPSSCPERFRASPGWKRTNHNESQMELFHGVHAALCSKKTLTPPTSSETPAYIG